MSWRQEEEQLRKRGFLAFLAVLAVALSVVLTGCGGGDGGGSGSTLKIVSDLPLQGSDRVQTEQMVRAIQFVLEQAGNKAGDYDIEFESNDDADCGRRQVGRGEVLRERPHLRRRRLDRRRHRHLQLGLRGDRYPDPERRRRWRWSARRTRTRA